MKTIPLIDIRSGSPVDLVQARSAEAKTLIEASRDTLGLLSRVASHLALPLGDRLSRDWLARTRNPYLSEIEAYAGILGIPGVYALNLCFEWGCTSGVYDKGQSAVLARVLDWVFPVLGEHIVVAHQSGAAGDFYNVTWPGVSGVFSAMAPGRFAAALNQAPMRRHGLNMAFDWAKNRVNMRHSAGLPPAHLLRKVFETATSYDEARHLLTTEEVALPVIYILAGVRGREGCVIERTENDAVLRPLGADRVCAANHFESRLNGAGKGWRPRPIDSAGRCRLAEAVSLNEIEGNFGWFKGAIANRHSRLVMLADAASGRLSVMGTLGKKPVTEAFRL